MPSERPVWATSAVDSINGDLARILAPERDLGTDGDRGGVDHEVSLTGRNHATDRWRLFVHDDIGPTSGASPRHNERVFDDLIRAIRGILRNQLAPFQMPLMTVSAPRRAISKRSQ
jgi:hypothetical protein